PQVPVSPASQYCEQCGAALCTACATAIHEIGLFRDHHLVAFAGAAAVTHAADAAGFIVDDGRLESVEVLIYRESRGWEIRYPFFRDQFVGARLGADLALDQDIDGISGATLSVRAMQKMARLALYFHDLVAGDGR
ncbi:MAG: FMN-binding protein, partial [Alphaproteobacteria bacterium]